jgi:ferredoxin-NADP reductase
MQVAAKSTVARDVVAIRLVDPAGGDVPSWEPGAHLDLILPGGLTRQYSLCGDPADTRSLTVAVLREAAGRGGSMLVHDKLEPGDILDVGGPRNHFRLADAASYLFIAGGIGITPLLPMVRQIARTPAAWRLLYGGRTRDSMAFADELICSYPKAVSVRPQDEHGLLDIDDALHDLPEGTLVYCCGPEPLLAAVESSVGDRGGLELHIERFTPKAETANAPTGDFEIELARSKQLLAVEAGESVLDALEKAGVAVEFSCREGTCGTCEVAVLAGTPDHRDSVLTADEQAVGDVMMVCVSRCLGSKLVLDL